MSGVREEPFHVAVQSLRDQLRTGALRPGERIVATDLAKTLRLSATPIREALSRLAGEGVLEDRRGQGFFVRNPSSPEVADLFRMSLQHLAIALDPHRPGLLQAQPSGASPDDNDPVAKVEQLFADLVMAGGSRALRSLHRVVQTQLGPIRRIEHVLFQDLTAEADALATPGLLATERLALIRKFHARRLAATDRLVAVAQGAADDPKV